MVHNLTKIARKDIKNLCGAYAALTEAYQADDHITIIAYSDILLRLQKELDVEMYSEVVVQTLLAKSKRIAKEKNLLERSASEVVADFVREHSAYV